MVTNIKIDELIYPYFLVSGVGRKERIDTFPGYFRFSVDRAIKDIEETMSLGIYKVLLFGLPDKKDGSGRDAYKKSSVIASAVKAIKKKFPELTVMTDVCLCAYTSHGHCGILKGQGLSIDNGKTLDVLSKIALSHAQAGADWVAPSAMAKKQVDVIRRTLDNKGYRCTKILGYSAKFASNFYGPFRNAAKSSPKFGDRHAYQLNFADGKGAIDEIEADIKEGADAVMVKPALSYLDVIKEARTKFPDVVLAAYNVSGEYAFVKHGARIGLWDEKKIVMEMITSIKRAGADFIITYHAKDIARWLRET